MGTLHQCGGKWCENPSTDHSLTQAVLTCSLPMWPSKVPAGWSQHHNSRAEPGDILVALLQVESGETCLSFPRLHFCPLGLLLTILHANTCLGLCSLV